MPSPVFRSLAVGLCLVASLRAEDPLFLGLRNAAAAMSSVDAETSWRARQEAAACLSLYVKPHGANHYIRTQPAGSRNWKEIAGLRLERVTAQAVSEADRANGIAGKWLASVDAGMYRTYDPKTNSWSQWHNGRFPFLPAAIHVVRHGNGRWSAKSSMLDQLVAVNTHGNASLIPHGSQPVSRNPRPVPVSAPAPQTRRTLPATTSPPARTPSPAEAATGHVMVTLFGTVFFLVFCLTTIYVAGVILRRLLRKKPRAGKPTAPSAQRGFPATPPPLPSAAPAPAGDLIEARSHLLSEAEQKFFHVLRPLVGPSCNISSKVRLADLFEVRPGRGQQAAFNKIQSKHIDFVLTDPATSRILCAIELDDSSHDRPDRTGRDEFVNELFARNSMPLLRVPCAWTYHPPALRDALAGVGVPVSCAA